MVEIEQYFTLFPIVYSNLLQRTNELFMCQENMFDILGGITVFY